MKRSELETIFNESFANLIQLCRSKNDEYSDATDVFANFNKAAGGLSFHCKREKVAWEFLTKHLQSIKDIIDSDTPSPKSLVDEKFNDAITYLLLIKAMCYENRGSDYDVDKIKYHIVDK